MEPEGDWRIDYEKQRLRARADAAEAKLARLVESIRELIANDSESTIDLGHRRDYPLTQWVDTTKLMAAISESEANNDNT